MKCIAIVLSATSLLLAQTETSLIGTGYAAPAPIEVAPGQIVTLFFRGVKPSSNGMLRSGGAQGVPLPMTVAGLSAHILQVPQTSPYPVPILAVRQHTDCEEVSFRPACILTAVRVQIPLDLTPTIAKLVLEEDGQPSRTFLVRPIRDNAHVITSCDLTWDTNPGSRCNRLAFHANGQAVDENSPAKVGETIVIYAHGLGPTLPRATTGNPSPAGATVIDGVSRQIRVGFQFFVNASHSVPRYLETDMSNPGNSPSFVGLTENQVGLYQINVAIPASLELPVRCGGEVRSNVLAKIATSQGVENLPVCVAP